MKAHKLSKKLTQITCPMYKPRQLDSLKCSDSVPRICMKSLDLLKPLVLPVVRPVAAWHRKIYTKGKTK